MSPFENSPDSTPRLALAVHRPGRVPYRRRGRPVWGLPWPRRRLRPRRPAPRANRALPARRADPRHRIRRRRRAPALRRPRRRCRPRALRRPAPAPTSSLKPPPIPGPFAMDLYRRGDFVSEMNKVSCVPAAMLTMINIMSPGADTTGCDPDEALRARPPPLAEVAEGTRRRTRGLGKGPQPDGLRAVSSSASSRRVSRRSTKPRERSGSPAGRSGSSPGAARTRGSCRASGRRRTLP